MLLLAIVGALFLFVLSLFLPGAVLYGVIVYLLSGSQWLTLAACLIGLFIDKARYTKLS